MTRDEMLLTSLVGGEGSTADLTLFTGLPERTVRRGLRRLIGSGHVFSPIRGSYRLTSAGSAVVLGLSPSDPATLIEQSREPHHERDAVPSHAGVPGWVWGAIVGAVAAAAVLGARQARQASQPPPPAPGPLRARPSGWRSAY
ncbi:MAG: hypothetical protein WAL64_06140 [Candidatus Dormiibacterota bacterium]